jgi:hypothetical protein
VLGHPGAWEVLGVLGQEDVGVDADGSGEHVAVLGVHLDVLHGREVFRCNVDEGVLDVGVHQLFEPVAVGLAESDPLAQVARHLIEDLLAPMNLDRACVGGIEEVVAQGPGEQDVGVSQDEADRQSTKPISLEKSASASAALSRRALRARWKARIASAGMRWCVPTLM